MFWGHCIICIDRHHFEISGQTGHHSCESIGAHVQRCFLQQVSSRLLLHPNPAYVYNFHCVAIVNYIAMYSILSLGNRSQTFCQLNNQQCLIDLAAAAAAFSSEDILMYHGNATFLFIICIELWTRRVYMHFISEFSKAKKKRL